MGATTSRASNTLDGNSEVKQKLHRFFPSSGKIYIKLAIRYTLHCLLNHVGCVELCVSH